MWSSFHPPKAPLLWRIPHQTPLCCDCESPIRPCLTSKSESLNSAHRIQPMRRFAALFSRPPDDKNFQERPAFFESTTTSTGIETWSGAVSEAPDATRGSLLLYVSRTIGAFLGMESTSSSGGPVGTRVSFVSHHSWTTGTLQFASRTYGPSSCGEKTNSTIS